MHFTKLAFDEYITKVAYLIGNSLGDERISRATARFGYDNDRLKMGENLYRRVKDISEKQNKAKIKKIKMHKKRRSVESSVRRKYMKILQIARIAFANDVLIRRALQLDGQREASLHSWLNQVSMFASRLSSENEWMKGIANYGISNDDIKDLLDSTEELRDVAAICEQEKENAKKLTAIKREELKKLQGWISDFLKIAKIALEDQPGLYNKIKNI
ncbi:hypothetical protein QA597_08650 [Marinilabiliaceae bacterium ANBcel2]|nr:hypothetical protein [Marinilabiliaceae bacterium ANBcel2]